MEPQAKRLHDLLISDFNEKKNQTIAAKNAIALMSKQNFNFAIAFFLLAQDVKSALQVAIGRLNDPVLAVLICRCMED